MSYFLCGNCCQEILQERELCEIDGKLFKWYLKFVKLQVSYGFKFLNLNTVTVYLFVRIGLHVKLGRINGWFVSIFCYD